MRLLYAGPSTTVPDPMTAIAQCPPGRIEILANYTAFRDLGTALEQAHAQAVARRRRCR